MEIMSNPIAWRIAKIEEIIYRNRPITYGIVQPGEHVSDGILLIRSQDYANGWKDLSAMMRVSKEIEKGYKRSRVAEGDLLITVVGANIGKMAMVPAELESANISRSVARISIDPQKAINQFCLYYLESGGIKRLLHFNQNGGAQPVLNLADLTKFKISLPTISEQQRIAAILSIWDLAIDVQEKLIAAKERQKKALMQQLLSGKKRFEEFSEPWKELVFRDFLKPVSRETEKPDKPFLSLGIRSHCKGTFLKPDFQPEQISLDVLYKVQKDDLIVNITFAWEGAIAIANEYDHNALVSHRFPTYVFNRKKVIPEFFKHIIIDKRLRYILGNISPGGAGRNRVLKKSDFLRIKWSLPSVPEQEKIASVLNTADREIQLLNKTLATLQRQKKALMQVLLTGKVRVKVASEND
ncbi:restriction endonuclease subunit S [candidate division KSB1 bacterium]|nr:restriction endonuclease subunit S [candidate division KSB1 bacterium]